MRLSEELIALIKDDKPGPDSFSNTALLYFNRQTFEQVKRELVPVDHWSRHVPGITQMFGIPIMLYHGIPLDEWELVQRISGENITKGKVWERSNGLAYTHCLFRWNTFVSVPVPDTKQHQCILLIDHEPPCVCECGNASLIQAR